MNIAVIIASMGSNASAAYVNSVNAIRNAQSKRSTKRTPVPDTTGKSLSEAFDMLSREDES